MNRESVADEDTHLTLLPLRVRFAAEQRVGATLLKCAMASLPRAGSTFTKTLVLCAARLCGQAMLRRRVPGPASIVRQKIRKQRPQVS